MANAPRANSAAAARYAVALMACYPGQQSQDEHVAKAYARQLAELCSGVELEILQAMIDPKYGIVSKLKFLPAIAEVSAFVAAREAPKRDRIGAYLDEIRELERPLEPVVSDEERKRRANMLRKTSEVIKQTARLMRRTRPNSIQADCRNRLMSTDIMQQKDAAE